ncbi:hypothetical protein CO172_00265 [Candidatus Uhrbacteria bacterium CG_4_9_14_3_um_filter_36_7]|uniref:Calcineurin-like phosphoesterase domain-containing protein n=1 Tax=Candidatus Uhrbacteria bacterium CG_4_9_14_3_um_filter_36_7 TaxID=1975033 RepID=A0A2M7XIR3_9BACT|nr:MAG: hypothetical protein CO172_00265 [Candidatus Uhrbacteria bacterium CG_4_9_14_3_um_filter_36_7]
MSLVFDGLILFLLIAFGIFLIELSSNTQRWNKTKKRVLFFISSIIWLILFYGSFVEPRMLVTYTVPITLSDNATTTLRAVVIADPHLGPYKKSAWIERVVQKIETLDPDIIFFLGDAIYNKGHQAFDLWPLASLNAPYGKYAITGNHDYLNGGIQSVKDMLSQTGFTVLENEREQILVKEKSFTIIGIDDLWNGGNLTQAIDRSLPSEDLKILLSHNPEVVLYTSAREIDFTISGHTHGGQIRLPWIGSVPSLPTLLGRFYDKGLFFVQDKPLFISAGIGESGPRARLWNPPEISLLLISF